MKISIQLESDDYNILNDLFDSSHEKYKETNIINKIDMMILKEIGKEKKKITKEFLCQI